MTFKAPLELLAGTRNQGKIREIQQLLSDLPITLRSLDDFPDLPTVDEVGRTYVENSALKALSYANWTKLPALADDSGLEVDCLDGMPGLLSARYGGDIASDIERTQKLLSELDQKQDNPQTARFVCCLTLAEPSVQASANDGEAVILHVSSGIVEGEIATEPRGTNGFGYDPVFVPIGYALTFAELPVAVKNRISHRAKALAEMKSFIERWLRQT